MSAITVLWKRSFNQAAFVSVNTSLPLFFIIWECLFTQNSSETLSHAITEKRIGCSKTIHTHGRFISNPEGSFTFTHLAFCVSPLSKRVSVCVYQVACSYQRPRYSSLSLRCSISPSASPGWPRPALYLWCWLSQSHSAAVLVVKEAGW